MYVPETWLKVLRELEKVLTRGFPAITQASLTRYRVLGLSLASTTRSQPDRLSRAFSCVRAVSMAVHLQNVPCAAQFNRKICYKEKE